MDHSAPVWISYSVLGICVALLALQVQRWWWVKRLYGRVTFDLLILMLRCCRLSWKWWTLLLSIFAIVTGVYLMLTRGYVAETTPDALKFYALGIFLGFIVSSQTLMPPAVLFLASSKPQSASMVRWLLMAVTGQGFRVAYLLDPWNTHGHSSPGFSLAFANDNFRTIADDKWHHVVHAFFGVAPVIVIDTRSPTAGVKHETLHALRQGFAHKTIFLVHSNGSSPIMDALDHSYWCEPIMTAAEHQVPELIRKRLVVLCRRNRTRSNIKDCHE